MRRHITLIVVGFIICFSYPVYSGDVFASTLNLMPMPQTIQRLDGKFRLKESFRISLEGNPTERISRGATRALRRLSKQTGLFFPQVHVTTNPESSADMAIHVQRQGALKLHEDESYRLNINSNKVTLTAETDIGALRGLETWLQLLDVDEAGYYMPCIDIEDAPRFPWRGLLIDVCRHFMPVDVIKRNLDGMAAVKLNVLHLHLTEDQGFRIECRTFPKLHELGSDGDYFTHAQIVDIIQYAADRGIRVVPEFDIPGHATSWFVGYPELASAPGPYSIGRTWGIQSPTFNPTIEETYTFFDRFFKEMTALFPDEYVHIGGDENDGKQWNANPDIRKFKKEKGFKDNYELQCYFNQRVLEILTKYNKLMMGWDEILHPEIPKTILIQSWRGRKFLIESAQKGYQTILSNGYYIDLIQSTDVHYLNDPYTEDMNLSEHEQSYILGGEATMWAEFVTPETIDSRIWPRTAAIAERFWSSGQVKDVPDMYRRLEMMRFWLEDLGLTHDKNYNRMLKRLTRNTDITALKTLVDVIEPVKNYQRGAQKAYTSYSPMTRVADAARPDADVARKFRNSVDFFLMSSIAHHSELSEIEQSLSLWKNNHNQLLKTIQFSPILKEITTLSEDLSLCAEFGLQAIDYFEKGIKPPKKWLKSTLKRIEQAKIPRGQTELMVLPAIEKLVNHAGKKG